MFLNSFHHNQCAKWEELLKSANNHINSELKYKQNFELERIAASTFCLKVHTAIKSAALYNFKCAPKALKRFLNYKRA